MLDGSKKPNRGLASVRTPMEAAIGWPLWLGAIGVVGVLLAGSGPLEAMLLRGAVALVLVCSLWNGGSGSGYESAMAVVVGWGCLGVGLVATHTEYAALGADQRLQWQGSFVPDPFDSVAPNVVAGWPLRMVEGVDYDQVSNYPELVPFSGPIVTKGHEALCWGHGLGAHIANWVACALIGWMGIAVLRYRIKSCASRLACERWLLVMACGVFLIGSVLEFFWLARYVY